MNPFTYKLHFWYTDTSLTHPGQVWISRSLGQGQVHMRKMIILLISTYLTFVWFHRSLIRSRSLIKVKVTHQGHSKNIHIFPFYVNFTDFYKFNHLYVINKVKVTLQGQGHILRSRSSLHTFNCIQLILLSKQVVCIWLKCVLKYFFPLTQC